MITLFFKWLFDLIINHRYKLLCDMHNFKYKTVLANFVIKDEKNTIDIVILCNKTLNWINKLPKNEIVYFEGLKTRFETLLLIHTKKMKLTFEGIDYEIDEGAVINPGDWYLYSDKNIMFLRQSQEQFTNKYSFRLLIQPK